MISSEPVRPSLLERRLTWKRMKQLQQLKGPSTRVAVLASFTADPIAPYLGTALHDEGITVAVEIAPFDQIDQCLLDPSMLGDPAPDLLIVWARLEDSFAGGPMPLVDGDAAGVLERFAVLAEHVVTRAVAGGTSVVVVLPAAGDVVPLGVGDAANVHGVSAVSHRVREALRFAVSGAPGVLVADADDVVRQLGSAAVFDHRRMALARVPYSEAAFAAMADRIARLVRVSMRGAAKVAVVDADNTLWGGVVGEDGADAIDLADNGPGVAFRSFQRYLLDLRRAGLLIALASKNNEDDAWEGFARGEMLLRREDLAAWRVGWEPKSAGIEAIADELNLGTASMVFVDDSGAELAEVASALPEVRGVQMPPDPVDWPAIARSGVFDRLPPTASDLARAGSYALETQRRTVRATTSLADYLASLGLIVRIFEPGQSDVARFAQLVAKTNQFTLGGDRHSEAQLTALLGNDRCAARLVEAVDAYGAYGVIGALIVRWEQEGPVRLDTFVLSCRAMGRGVEDAMLADAVRIARSVGTALTVRLVTTAKNTPIRRWLAGRGIEADRDATIAVADWPAHVGRGPNP